MRSFTTEKLTLSVIIPALNEEGAIGQVVSAFATIQSEEFSIKKIIVVDNNSTDATAERARTAGALVVPELREGYGAACLKGISYLTDEDIVVFADGDGSDIVEDLTTMIVALKKHSADLVVGSRIEDTRKSGVLPFQQRFGNALVTSLLGWPFGVRLTDLGPFRIIKREVLEKLNMRDRGFGWTVEMEFKVLAKNFVLIEVPVRYRKRIAGVSKISGTLRGSILAGVVILSVLFRGLFEHYLQGINGNHSNSGS